MTTSPNDEATVVVRKVGALGRIELNKPKAINALSTDMVQAIDQALKEWRPDTEVAAVLLTGRGDRGLCAGGDIKAIYRDLTSGTGESIDFWADEYAMNYDIAEYPKPYIAILDGITMGGGVGVSVHGSHRIVNESSSIGMPETGIGLFPDVGATYLLAKMPGQIGMYMGLTGQPIGPGAAIAYGLADTYVPRDQTDDLIEALEAEAFAVDTVIGRFAGDAPENELASDEDWINSCFAGSSVSEIIAALRAHGGEKAGYTADLIATRSPRSLAVTFEMIRSAGSMSLHDVLERDFRVASEIGKRPDLQEGIRAQVIDKDRNPQWNPATLIEITPEEVSDILNTQQERKVFND
jgi:enoyl-CoA hydratase